jgi:GntR family transcriptional repressor for pyruvate dehydrogenase complex
MSAPRSINVRAVRPRRLTDEIVHQIEQLILSSELRVGDALPPERELAAQLQVSRNILREALSMLVQKGLLVVRPGSGAYVNCPSAEILRDHLHFLVHFNASAFYDLVEARRALEVEIADLAARRATAEDIQCLKGCLHDMEETVGDPERYVEADVSFHAALARATGNEILRLLVESFRGALRQNIHILLSNHPTAVQDALRSHHDITRAVEARSPEAARHAMSEHLESVRHGLRELGVPRVP